MKSDTFYGDFMVKLIWRFSGSLIYHVVSMKTSDILHNFSCVQPLPHFNSKDRRLPVTN